MDLLTNENLLGYEKILQMEDFSKLGRRIVWLGAQMNHKNQWLWQKEPSEK